MIPYLLVATIALALVITLVGFCAGRFMNSNKLKDKKDVSFSSEDSSSLTKLAVSTLSKTKSITSLFNVHEIHIDEVEDIAKSENSIVTVVVPAGFMNSLMTGDNYPIKLYFSSTTSIYSLIITELSLAAQTTLQAAQSAVYTLYDYYDEKGNSSYAEAANEEINLILVKKAFSRDKMFTKEQVSSTGNYGVKVYYIASGILTIILLLGCIFILRSKSIDDIILLKLNQSGIGCISQSVVRILSIFVTTYILFSVICIAAYITGIIKSFDFNIITALINGFGVCLCSSAIISFISAVMKSRFSSNLLLFISVITCEFISGAFLPSVFLPDSITSLDKYIPTGYMLNLTRLILSGDSPDKNFIIVMEFFMLFFILTIVFTYTRINKFGKTKRKAGA